MELVKCKMCGAPMKPEGRYVDCQYCGNRYEMYKGPEIPMRPYPMTMGMNAYNSWSTCSVFMYPMTSGGTYNAY